MNVDLARKLDRYLGVPLCFAGTAVHKLFRLFTSRPQRAPRRILFIELSEMGSAVLADPAMRKLRDSLQAELYFATFGRNSGSLDLLGTIPPENVFRMNDTGLTALAADVMRFLFWTRAKGIDTVVDLELFSRFTALLTGLSGARLSAGFHAFHAEGLYRGDFLTHRVLYNPHQHIAKNFVALANALLAERSEVPYSKTVIADEEIAPRKIPVSEEAMQAELQKVKRLFPRYDRGLHRLILFNTNASDLIPLRRWPQHSFAELASRIIGEYDRAVIALTGSASERAEKEDILRAVGHERCISLAGQTAIADLPALYAASAFMLTNDSGPAHVAALTAMPVFVLFGPETPKLYGPLGAMTPLYAGLACSPCVTAANHRKTACSDNVCLKSITTNQVFEVLKPSLDAW